MSEYMQVAESNTEGSVEIDRTSCEYQSQFCEENVHRLITRLGCPEECFAVFISSESKFTPIWSQRAASSPENPVCWDYHVILLRRLQRPNGSIEYLVYDLDSTLPFPSKASLYFDAAFPSIYKIKRDCQQLFRVVKASVYHEYFASDRSHMDASTVTFPSWPVLKGALASSNMNLFTYVEMNHGLCCKILDLIAYVKENKNKYGNSDTSPSAGLGIVCSKSTMETLFRSSR